MVLAIDIDGVLADFNRSYGRTFIKISGEDKFPAGWEDQLADNEFPPVWSWEGFYGYSPEVEKKVWTEAIFESKDFWRNLDPLPHTRWTLAVLNARAKAGDDVYFLTNRAGQRAKTQTEMWLYEHGMNFPTVILSGDKTPLLRALKVNFFVDDKPETIVDAAAVAASEGWKDFQLFIRDAPYNRQTTVPNCQRVGSVKEALITAGLWEPPC